MLDVVTTLISGALSLGLVLAILAFIYKRHAEEWQYLAMNYGDTYAAPIKTKRFGQFILYMDGSPARTYKGVMAIEVLGNGIRFRPNRFLVPFHDPVFIPYKDIKGWQQTWYLDGKSVEIEFAKAPGARIIMPQSQLDWIKQSSGKSIIVSREKPPHGNWPRATYAAAMLSGAMGLSVIGLWMAKHYGLIFL